jgi:3',5'-cyclic AMP phosphodiesterase CpdA
MKVKWKKICGAALICTMVMGNLTYAAPLPGNPASDMDQNDLETILNDGLVMHSSFDKSSISGNKVKDQTGRGNDGTIYGQPVFVKGIRGNGISINNGSKAGQPNTKADQYITYGQTADLKFGTEDFSLSFWMKTENHGQNNGTILSNKNYLSGSNIGWAFGNFNNASDVDMRMNFSGTGNSRVELKGIPANDDKWHHVAGSFDRDGDMTVYLDGEKYSSASMAGHKGKSVDTGLDFILGGDGRVCYGMSGCTIDELRVYKKAINASAVKTIYETEGVMATVEQMEKQLASIKPGSQYPLDRIRAMELEIENVKNGLEGMTAAAAIATVRSLKEKYNEFLEGSEPLCSFQVVSDVHIKSDNLTDTNAMNFIAGLKDMKTISPDSLGVLNLGDFTQNGTEVQYNGIYNIMDQYSPVSDDKVIMTLGNHDVRGYNSADWNKDETVISAYWPAAKALYLKKNKRYMPNNGEALYFDRWMGGYHFIVINTENGLKDAMYLSQEQLNWLEETMAENASPDKPIFVMGHNALKDTHWRSNILLDFGNQDSRVKEIFSKYPQVIYMSGHIHNGFGVAEAIDREYGTLIDVPSYNESENGGKEAGIGYHVKIYEDSVVFKARNFKTSAWLPEFDITVDIPGLPAVYKKAKSLNPGDYTPESYGKVLDLMEEGKGIFQKVYDQSKLTYENVGPPEVSLFTREVRDRINELGARLSAAMEELESTEKVTVPIEDVYLQGGSDAGRTSSQYSNYDASKLRVKFSDGQQNYTRRTVMTFDLSGVERTTREADLVLELTGGISNTNPAKDFVSAEIYEVKSDWNSGVLTWNTKPERLRDKADGIISKDNISGGIVTTDVSKSVRNALNEGKTAISFEISCPVAANDNMIDFYSTRSEGKEGPRLITRTAETEKPVDPQFQKLRDKWLGTLSGGTLDTGNEAVRTYIKGMDEKAGEYWNTMIKGDDGSRTNLWNDLDMSYIKGTGAEAKVHSGNVAETFYRLKDMAIAWATKGCQMYQDEEVKNELILALEFMNEHHYNSSDDKTPVFGNWWHWEIGGPIAFLDTALILYEDLTPEQIGRYAAAVSRFTNVCDQPSGYPGSPAMTGANLIDKGMVVVQTGLLTDNREKLDHVKKAYKTVFEYVTTGDGFYEDGSFIQHQALSYMGGYGSQLYEKLSILFSVFSGTDFELTYEDHAEQLIFDMVFKGIEPFIYNGLCMDMVSGRDVTRKTSNDKARGAGIMDAMMLIGDAMPAEQQDRFNSMMKYFIGMDEDYYYSHSTHIASLMKANQIMNDGSIEPRSEYVLHKLFAGMDKLVHIMPGFGFALSMHSSRTYGHELINDEGKRTWNISDGMTYLYNNDRDQYGDGYWATVDPKRLAGTTTEFVTRPNGAGDRTKNIYSWVGGSSLGNYGGAGMHYKTLGNSGSTRSGTDAKKSWFMFDDEIAAVGSGITSSTGNYVETIIDNRRLNKDGSNEVLINGEAKDIRDDGEEHASKGTKIAGASWIHLEGNTAGSDIGYYFPEKADVMALKEKRTGNWNTQGTTEGEETNLFATFWFEHGKKPANADYSYVILPGKTAEETAQYSETPDIEVIECSEDAHGVREKNLGITAVNFWNNKVTTVAGITSNKAASITMQINGDEATIGVSDPTQENNGTIELSLPYTGGDMIESDANVEVLQKTPFIKLAVRTAGLAGQTSKITLKVLEPEKCEIIGFSEEFNQIKTDPGTKFTDLQLPKTVDVYDNAGGTHTLDIQWERGDYQKDVLGTYDLTGQLVLPEGLYNTAGFAAFIQVQVGDEYTPVMDNVYVQGGSDSDKNFGGSAYLIVKYDAGAQNYTRKSLMKFSLELVPESAQAVYLAFELTGTPSADFTSADIYQVENDWEGATVTFNSFPARIGINPVSSFTKAMTSGNLIQKLDVTEAVNRAKINGETEISFEISIPTKATNNYVGIHSSRTVAEGAVKPSLVWESDYEAEKVIKKNLSFVIDLASNINAEDYSNVDEKVLARLVEDAKRVLQDPDAEMEEIHEMERRLTQELIKYRRM